MVGSLERVTQAIKAYSRFLITWHVDPDPDCVGSGLALLLALQALGKEVIAVSPDPLGDWFDFLPGIEFCRVFEAGFNPPVDAVIVEDCEPDRCGGLVPFLKSGVPVINIDHHGTNRGFGEAFYIDSQAAATGEIVYELITEHMGVSLTRDMATNLYAALSGDTGTFRYSNTSSRVLFIAGELARHGADPGAIAAHLYENKPFEEVNLIREVLDTLEISPNGEMGWITVTRMMLGERQWSGQRSEDLIKYPRMIKTVKLAIMFRELELARTKVSFRSRNNIDASKLARLFGGGGHMYAAGCTIDKPLPEAKAMVLEAAAELLAAEGAGVSGGEEGKGGNGRNSGTSQTAGNDLT
ncbi:MAG TPA: bifunctional oligoribonuclease/PAP phosphatase NrnA [Firmicutes bacterium]|nr:bifunctional oligoribonuclease/PAP phosphatase NrnA [Bacillota bacterium]